MSADAQPSQRGWRIVVPRLWGWCQVGPTFESEQAARDSLTQFGPFDGRVVSS